MTYGDAPALRKSRGYRVALTSYCALAMATGGYLVFALGALAPFIIDDLSLSRTQLGLISTCVLVVSAVASPFSGRATDRFHGRLIPVVMFGLATLGLVLMAVAHSYAWLFLGAPLYGLVSSMTTPMTNRMVAEQVPAGSRSVIMGVKQSGVQAGAFFAGLALPGLALLAGWRGAMLVSAGVVATGLLATPFMVTRGSRGESRRAPHARRPLESLVWRLTLYAILMGFGASAVSVYLVLYGVQELGLKETAAGFAAAAVGLGGVVGRILWARRGEVEPKATSTLVIMALGGATAIAAVWAAAGLGAWAYFVGALAFGGTAAAWNSVGNLMLVSGLPDHVAGRATGVMQAGFYGGYAASPVVFGSLVDGLHSYEPGWALVIGVLVSAALLLVLWRRRDAGRVTEVGRVAAQA